MALLGLVAVDTHCMEGVAERVGNMYIYGPTGPLKLCPRADPVEVMPRDMEWGGAANVGMRSSFLN